MPYPLHDPENKTSTAHGGSCFIISFGRYGGFYFLKEYTICLCLGWVSITYIPDDIDNLINGLLKGKRK